MKKLIYIIILILIALGAYAYFTQDAVTPATEEVMEEEVMEEEV